MALTLTSRPESKGAIFNPSIYRFQRKDSAFNQVNNAGGFAQFQINGVDLTTLFVVGDSIYVASSNDFDDFTTVTASAYTAGNTLVTTGLAYLAGDGGTSADFLNNLTQRPSHKVAIEVYYASDNTLLFPTVIKYSSNSKGLIIADVSAFISPILTPDVAGYDMVSDFKDDGASVTYYIKYAEAWTGSSELQTDDVANPLTTIYAARQVGETSNSMIDYFITTTLGTKKFLTSFDRPRYTAALPFQISAFLDAGNYTFVQKRYLNGVVVDTITRALVVASPNAVYRLKLDAITFSGATPLIDRVDVWFINAGTDILTEVKSIDVVELFTNSITLVWLSSLSGLEQFTFQFNQEYTFTHDNGRKYKRKTLIATQLTADQWDALDGLNTLGELYNVSDVELAATLLGTRKRIGQQVYVMDSDGDLTEVIVIPTANRTFTKQVIHNFEVTIEYPETFLQR